MCVSKAETQQQPAKGHGRVMDHQIEKRVIFDLVHIVYFESEHLPTNYVHPLAEMI